MPLGFQVDAVVMAMVMVLRDVMRLGLSTQKAALNSNDSCQKRWSTFPASPGAAPSIVRPSMFSRIIAGFPSAIFSVVLIARTLNRLV